MEEKDPIVDKVASKRTGVRVGLVLAVVVVIALELTRKPPPPPELKQQPVTSDAPTNVTLEPISTGPIEVGFDKLGAFPIQPPPVTTNAQGLYVQAPTSIADQIPTNIVALNGRQVLISGFMQPIRLDKGRVSEFLLFRDRDTCCFGGTPAINHWIGVKLTNDATAAKLGRPITVRGTLTVGEIRSDGFLVGLYSMLANEVTDAEF